LSPATPAAAKASTASSVSPASGYATPSKTVSKCEPSTSCRASQPAAAPAGAEVRVGGQTMAYADVRAATERDLSVVFPVAAVLFVLILALLLRAALAPLYLVAMVVLGFAATLGATALTFGGAFSVTPLPRKSIQFTLNSDAVPPAGSRATKYSEPRLVPVIGAVTSA
jgi:multidrug efflux pump subunit AcrB